MTDIGKIKLCISLQIEHLNNGIFLHQKTYIEKVLKIFYMGKAYILSIIMVVNLLNVEKDPIIHR